MSLSVKMKDAALVLQGMDKKLSNLLPKNIPSDKFKRTVMLALERNPDLLGKDQQSLFKACQLAAADGLLPDGRQAALVPFGNQVQYLPMVQGILQKLRNSGELKSISVQVVYEHDEFDFWTDEEGQHIKHRPNLIDPGSKKLAYAVAKLKDGGVQIEVMTTHQIEQVKAVSRAASSKSSPWQTFEDEMWRKTVLRRICKYLPSSTELDRVYANDNEVSGVTNEIDVTPKEQTKSAIEGLLEENGVVEETGEITNAE